MSKDVTRMSENLIEFYPEFVTRLAERTGVAELTAEQRAELLAETAEERQARERVGHERRLRLWETGVRSRFREARMSDLAANDFSRPVAGWWESSTQHLLLHSKVAGVGKSHVAIALGYQAVEAGAWALMWTATGLLDAIRPNGDANALSAAQECDLLVIDDLGAENVTEWTSERLFMVIDGRWANNRRTIFTTNLSGEALMQRYDERVTDRITDDALIVEVRGESRRAPAPY